MDKDKKRVLVVGGGFGGIKTALELCRNKQLEVTLLSDREYFRYYPMLYRTATGGKITASRIPLSEIFAGKNVRIAKATAKTLDRQNRQLLTEDGQKFPYDELVVAMGVVTNYFGIKGLEEYAYGIKSVEEARRLRNHLHKLMLDDGKPDVNYIVVGGGPTGVELAGALPGYLRHIMDKHKISKTSLHIDLVEAAPKLMPRMPDAYSKAITKHLQKLGVTLYLGQTVEAETADQLVVSGHSIDSHTVVWTAGVTNHPFLKANDFKLNEHGKALVDDFLRAEPNIYVIGDNADTPYSGMAQTALFDARFVAGNFSRQLKNKSPVAYKPKKPIYVTPVGPHWAAVQWGGLTLHGRVGWLLRAAADFMGYKDYEPWWKAGKHWLAEEEDGDETCPDCQS